MVFLVPHVRVGAVAKELIDVSAPSPGREPNHGQDSQSGARTEKFAQTAKKEGWCRSFGNVSSPRVTALSLHKQVNALGAKRQRCRRNSAAGAACHPTRRQYGDGNSKVEGCDTKEARVTLPTMQLPHNSTATLVRVKVGVRRPNKKHSDAHQVCTHPVAVAGQISPILQEVRWPVARLPGPVVVDPVRNPSKHRLAPVLVVEIFRVQSSSGEGGGVQL